MKDLIFELGLQYAWNFDQGKNMASTVVQFDSGRGFWCPMTVWSSSQADRGPWML